tara:strand:+ start:1109 stop:1318 length:210 start_codon:yes stop_codon:yes gene_type:complete
MKLTNEMVEQWLGTSNQLEEAIDVITEIANGEYSTKMLKQDIEEYYNSEEDIKDTENLLRHEIEQIKGE